MSLEQLTLSDEQVQDIVASLITGGGGSDVLYDDENDTLTVSLSDSISVNTLEADTLVGADIKNASKNEILVAQGDGTLAAETQSQGPNPFDEAESFTESDLTLDLTSCTVANGSVELVDSTTTDTGAQVSTLESAVGVGDVTGDGQNDIIFIDPANNVKYYNVANDTITDTGNQAYVIETGDVTDNGQEDIIFRDTSSNLKYYDVANDSTTDTGEQIGQILPPADVTGNNQKDIVFETKNDNFKYYDVANATVTDTGESGKLGTTADVTGDGRKDIVFLDTTVKFHDVANSSTTDTGIDAVNFTTGDVTGDGQTDIVAHTSFGDLKYYDTSNSSTTDTGLTDVDVEKTADVTGDGRQEIVFKDFSDNLKYYDVSNSSTTDISQQGTNITLADITGDGRKDIVFKDSSGNLVYYDFVDSSTTDTGGDSGIFTTGDITNNGQAEIVYRDSNGNLKYYSDKPATSGTAILEWSRPTDIFEWDVVTFTRTLDNETVDVFVAYSTDGGSTWQRTNSGNPITRNYSLKSDSNISSDDEVRIESELSRADTANNPTLDSAYRSWLV